MNLQEFIYLIDVRSRHNQCIGCGTAEEDLSKKWNKSNPIQPIQSNPASLIIDLVFKSRVQSLGRLDRSTTLVILVGVVSRQCAPVRPTRNDQGPNGWGLPVISVVAAWAGRHVEAWEARHGLVGIFMHLTAPTLTSKRSVDGPGRPRQPSKNVQAIAAWSRLQPPHEKR